MIASHPSSNNKADRLTGRVPIEKWHACQSPRRRELPACRKENRALPTTQFALCALPAAWPAISSLALLVALYRTGCGQPFPT